MVLGNFAQKALDLINSSTPDVSLNFSCLIPLIWHADPLLVQAARGERVSRPPAWMMRQAGRYMAVYRKLAGKHPSFRERSETTDLIVEISLQPWQAFRPDGVIIFFDILTPLPAFGVPFDIEEVRGPVIHAPIRTEDGLKALHPIDLEKLNFVGESLGILREEDELEAELEDLENACLEQQSLKQATITTTPPMPDAAVSNLTSKLQHESILVSHGYSRSHGYSQFFSSCGRQLPAFMRKGTLLMM
ncbi:hypothetical protein Drorol1_Dr00014993 [Drosera rotundifolia]